MAGNSACVEVGFSNRLFASREPTLLIWPMIEPLGQMHVVCETQRVCCEFCLVRCLLSHLVPILTVDLEKLRKPRHGF